MAQIVDAPVEGYTRFWADPYTNGCGWDRQMLLQELLSATENYLWIALDLLDLNFAASNATLIQLRTVLKYFYNAAWTTYRTAKGLAANYMTRDLLDDLHKRLSALGVALLMLHEDLVAPLRSPVPPRDKFWMVPNAQPLELLVSAILQGLPNNSVLGDLRTKLRSTHLFTCQHDRAEIENSEAGLPLVLHVCMAERQVGCNGDEWKTFDDFNRDARGRRRNRFVDVDWTDSIRDTVVQSNTRIGYVITWFSDNDENFGRRAQNKSLSIKGYNHLVTSMYNAGGNYPPLDTAKPGGKPLPGRFGYNHLNESGRAFHGLGADMFTEMSRCWKCRFVYHYQVTRPMTSKEGSDGLTAEDPRQTSWIWNKEFKCAEDLCHYRCWAVNNGQKPGSPDTDLVFKPFPSVD